MEEEVRLLYPWLPPELVTVYTEAYIEYGNAKLAWQTVRQSSAYERYFPGNRRDDGSLRLSEQDYVSTLEGYDAVFEAVGLNPKLFKGQYVKLIEGDVSADELFATRIEPIYERVLSAGDAIIREYADLYGLDLTPEAIVAGIIDPDLGVKILNRQITMAEIGGEAADRGFDITKQVADTLFEQGMGRQGADEFFGQAANLLPTLSVLANRHADPDDEFSLEDFVGAELMSDPMQRRRMRRLVAQEQAGFVNLTGGIKYRTDQRSGLRTGLTAV